MAQATIFLVSPSVISDSIARASSAGRSPSAFDAQMETNGGRIQGRDKRERDRRDQGARAPAGARDRDRAPRSPQGEPHCPPSLTCFVPCEPKPLDGPLRLNTSATGMNRSLSANMKMQ